MVPSTGWQLCFILCNAFSDLVGVMNGSHCAFWKRCSSFLRNLKVLSTVPIDHPSIGGSSIIIGRGLDVSLCPHGTDVRWGTSLEMCTALVFDADSYELLGLFALKCILVFVVGLQG